MKNRILYIVDCNLSTIGGTQKSLATIIENMEKKEHDIYLLEPYIENDNYEFEKKYYYRNFTDKKGLKKITYIIYSLIDYRKIIKRVNPEIIHAQSMSSAIILSLLKKFLLINRKIKIVFTDRGYLPTRPTKNKLLSKILFRKFSLITTTTEINRKAWIDYAKIDSNKIVAITNVLDNNWFEYDEKIKQMIVNKYNLNDKFVIGFAGRLDYYKKWDDVLKITTKLASISEKYIFAVAVSPGNDYSNVDEFEKKFKNELGERILVFKNLNENQMKEFYYMLDAFVLTSYGESFGRTLVEAMTKKCIVFGTNSGGVPEVIEDDNFLFPVSDIKVIVDKIINLNDKKINDIKNGFYKFASSKYKVDQMINKLEKEYLKIK